MSYAKVPLPLLSIALDRPSIVDAALHHPSTPSSLAHGKSVTVPCLQHRILCVVLLELMNKMVEYSRTLYRAL